MNFDVRARGISPVPRLRGEGARRGGRFEVPTGKGMVEFDNVRFDNVDFSGTRFWSFRVLGSAFTACDFRKARLEAGNLGAMSRPSTADATSKGLGWERPTHGLRASNSALLSRQTLTTGKPSMRNSLGAISPAASRTSPLQESRIQPTSNGSDRRARSMSLAGMTSARRN